MDEADAAQEKMEFEERMRRMLRRSVPEAFATGACLHCSDPVEAPIRWCSAPCRNEWQRAQDAAKRNGRVEP